MRATRAGKARRRKLDARARALALELRKAWVASGLTLPELAEQAGLECSKHSLSRKLNGLQKFELGEADAVAEICTIRVTLGGGRRRN